MDFQWRTQYHRTTSTLPTVIGIMGLFSVLMVVFLICRSAFSNCRDFEFPTEGKQL